ncbi:hypothetical protein HB779_20970 (plasmid) [Phyllobacterium sp. 628]|uniref:hypothetical protein n=1 Tax=Phyllobacterium sp. 628 TaxID=2718938 RepID=UPI001662831B|nr:hypothetical protein [Phyllobacterium sp. 628]QND54397.1 hypothetical protein HB779_20970 [Phyllobacterium sp. 628]
MPTKPDDKDRSTFRPEPEEIEDQFLNEDRIAEDELAIQGEHLVESEDAGDLSEDDDDNSYQESDEALPDDDEEREIARDPEREGRRFND